MATYTENYVLEKPTYAELADVAVLNRNMDKVDDVMHASQVSLAPAYEESETYNTDDVVMYEMLMYKCLEDNVTGAWDGTKWERTTASECGGGGSIDFDIFGEGSGATVTITDGAEAGLAECIAEIEATQDLHGYSKPWAGGAGKNKYPDTQDINLGGTNPRTVTNAISVPIRAGTYVISWKSTGEAIPNLQMRIDGVNTSLNSGSSFTVTSSANQCYWFITTADYDANKTAHIYDIQIESGSTPSGYEPYSNICPIVGRSEVNITVSDGETDNVTTIPLDRTVYGGTLDVTRGILTVTWGYIASYNGESIPSEWISDRDKYQAGTTPTTGAEVAYKLTTPQTFNLTPEEVSTILGYNNISADSGEVSVVYVRQTAPIKPNPTGADIPLKGIEIDGEKFKIKSGGYHKALIWDSGSPTTGASYTTDYALLDNLSNYNQIILMVSNNIDRADVNHQYSQQIWLDVEYLLSSEAWHKANITGFGSRYFDVSFTDSSFRIIQGDGEDGHLPTVFQIYGVRY